MFPSPFEYYRPTTLAEAVALLRENAEDAKLLAGGHSLLPMMKLRLASPAVLVDLARVPGLSAIQADGDPARIGAMTTHAAIEASAGLRARWRALAEAAGVIGDPQVRNRGTIGGSLGHADPAADLPAALLAFEASVRVVGSAGERTLPLEQLFTAILTTALANDEIISEVLVPAPPPGSGSAYAKFPHPASRFAVAGVAAVVTLDGGGACRRARIGVTGAAATAGRARAAEAALEGGPATADRIAAAAERAADGLECLGDLVASPAYRAHLTRVLARRALTSAAERARG
jgi:carbon-monoxide dehydrogenase medium subunit